MKQNRVILIFKRAAATHVGNARMLYNENTRFLGISRDFLGDDILRNDYNCILR